MAKTMRAARGREPGRIELEEVPVPTPGEGEVLLRVNHCGICGSDLHWFHGGIPVPNVCPGTASRSRASAPAGAASTAAAATTSSAATSG